MSSSSPLSPAASVVALSRPSLFRSYSSSSANGLSQDIFGRKDKPRLYLALYSRGGTSSSSSYASSITCDSYHWVLLVGSQSPLREQAGTVYQIAHSQSSTSGCSSCSTSFYEETNLSQQSEAQRRLLLARITLAKVIDEGKLRSLLRTIPSSTTATLRPSTQPDSGYDTDDLNVKSTCLQWVKEAYKVLTVNGKCLKGYIGPEDWPDIEEVARMYMRKKRRQGRFGGQARVAVTVAQHAHEIPTWNFWENRETTN